MNDKQMLVHLTIMEKLPSTFSISMLSDFPLFLTCFYNLSLITVTNDNNLLAEQINLLKYERLLLLLLLSLSMLQSSRVLKA